MDRGGLPSTGGELGGTSCPLERGAARRALVQSGRRAAQWRRGRLGRAICDPRGR